MKLLLIIAIFVVGPVVLATAAILALVHGAALPLLKWRFTKALVKLDLRRARSIAAWIHQLSPKTNPYKAIQYMEPVVALTEGRYTDARAQLEVLEREATTVEMQAIQRNLLAWTLIELAEPTRAVELAEASLASDVLSPSTLRAAEHTRAVAWLLTGRIAEARATLESEHQSPSLEPSSAHSKAARWYWLGEARRMSGEGDARDAYTRSLTVDPNGLYRKRAEERLAAVAPYR